MRMVDRPAGTHKPRHHKSTSGGEQQSKLAGQTDAASFGSWEAKITASEQVGAALAWAYSETVMEVYRRVVIHGEPWVVPSGHKGGPAGGVRAELIGRGWLQREATSMLVQAQAAQASAVESAVNALERLREALVQVDEKLAWAKAGTSQKRVRQRHGLSRRRDTLTASIERLQRRLDNHDIRVCFGTRKLALAGNNPAAYRYASRRQWRDRWDRARHSAWYCQGDKQAVGGNYAAQVTLDADGGDYAWVHVPRFLAGQLGCDQRIKILLQGGDHGRAELARAIQRDRQDHQNRIGAWEQSQAHYGVQRALGFSEAGLAAIGLAKPRQSQPDLLCHEAVSIRLCWRERKQAWYIVASWEKDMPVVLRPSRALRRRYQMVLGVDLNPDHLAWCLIDSQGNPQRWGKIPLDLTGTAQQNADQIGRAVAELVRLAKHCGAPIAHEILDFTRKRAELRYLPRRLARLLSGFAYSKFATTLASRCAREGVARIPVNPAWTSVLGQANYAGVYGVSVDQGAGCVIARRALGFATSVRPQVACQVPRSGPDEHTSPPPTADWDWAGLKLVAKTLPTRRSTWEPNGLCTRNSKVRSAPATGPPGQGEDGCPAPTSDSLPAPSPASAGSKAVPRSEAVVAAPAVPRTPGADADLCETRSLLNTKRPTTINQRNNGSGRWSTWW